MESLLNGLSQHGYSILFAVIFLETLGIPVPAALALLFAGAASANGSAQLRPGLCFALGAMILGDILMFLVGRYTGWWLLGMLCRLSLNPESCILSFGRFVHRRGPRRAHIREIHTGLNTMAPPLAGSMNMRLAQFLRFDCWEPPFTWEHPCPPGFLLAARSARLPKAGTFSHVLGWVVGSAILGYVAYRIWMWKKGRSPRSVVFVSPRPRRARCVFGRRLDLRRPQPRILRFKRPRIKGSRRLEPNAVSQLADEIPNGRRIYLYCTCVREATSARIAQVLAGQGRHCAVIQGGLRAGRRPVYRRKRCRRKKFPASELRNLWRIQ